MRTALFAAAAAMWLSGGIAEAKPRLLRFTATAHSVEGITARGGVSHTGTVAADPSVLPLGTRIRVKGAGRYSGTYIVTDTGAKVDGRTIDIYLPNDREAKVFGRKSVTVQVLRWGDNKRKPAETAKAIPASKSPGK